MLADYAVVAAVAAIGIAIVWWLFASVSAPSQKKKDAARVLSEASASKPAKSSSSPAQQKPREPAQPKKEKQQQEQPAKEQPAKEAKETKSPTQPQPSKKDNAAAKKAEADRKKKEQEEAEFIAREIAGVNSGLGAQRAKVTTLDEAREQNRQKTRKGVDVDTDVKPEFTESQKLKEKAHGFKIVQTKEELAAKQETKKVSSPNATSAVDGGNFKAVRGRRGSPSGNGAATDRDDLERKLAQFFKGNGGGRRNKDRDFDAPAKKTDKPKPVSETSGVTMKGNIAAAEGNAWAGEREW